jgi:hypothetical protein
VFLPVKNSAQVKTIKVITSFTKFTWKQVDQEQ